MDVSRVAVVGDDEEVAAAVARTGADVVARDVESAREAEPGLLLAAGERAVIALANADIDRPILPVAAGPAVPHVARDAAEAAMVSLLEADDFAAWTRSYPRLAVSLGEEWVAAGVMDVTLVTAEPARISEYAVESAGEPVAQFRADGVVVATPLGSGGYAGAAGGPRLKPGTGVGAVVPIAPFATRSSSWVLPFDSIALSVCRDEGDVSLLVDDREVASVPRGRPVSLAVEGSVALVCPSGCPGWAGPSNWKNSNGPPSE